MSIIVYYNFPKISLNLTGVNDSTTSIIQYTNSSGQTTTNIKYLETNYSAVEFFFTKNAGKYYFVVECKDSNSNPLFIAIPLTLTPSLSPTNISLPPTNSKTDIDNIIVRGDGSETGISDIPLTLNNIISTINTITCYTSTTNNVVTIVTESFKINTTSTSLINVQEYTPSTFNKNITFGTTGGTTGKLQLQPDLDWVMTCELLTEDGEVLQMVEQESAAITITYFMTSLIVVCFVYIVSPIFYKKVFMNGGVLAKLNDNHYAINFYFAIFFIVLSATFLIYGIRTNTRGFYFIFMAIILSFFSGRTAVFAIPGIANSNGTDFAKLDDPFLVFSAFWNGVYCPSPGLGEFKSGFYLGIFLLQDLIMLIFIVLFISTTIAGIVKQNIGAFITGIVFYCLTPLYILGFIANT